MNPQPWAEDGAQFILRAIENSFYSVLIPYAGYFHIIPRLVTLFSLQFGLSNTPFLMNFSALLIAIFSISYLFNKRFRFIIRNDLLRLVSAIFIALIPVYEVFLNITNIQWFLIIYLTLWASDIIFNKESSEDAASFWTIPKLIFTVLAFLTTPLSIILLPFLIYVIIERLVLTL